MEEEKKKSIRRFFGVCFGLTSHSAIFQSHFQNLCLKWCIHLSISLLTCCRAPGLRAAWDLLRAEPIPTRARNIREHHYPPCHERAHTQWGYTGNRTLISPIHNPAHYLYATHSGGQHPKVLLLYFPRFAPTVIVLYIGNRCRPEFNVRLFVIPRYGIYRIDYRWLKYWSVDFIKDLPCCAKEVLGNWIEMKLEYLDTLVRGSPRIDTKRWSLKQSSM